MNSELLKNYVQLREENKQAYESYLIRIEKTFLQVKQNHDNNACIRLESQLNALHDFKGLRAKDKQEIYRYFVQRNVQGFCFLRNNQQVELRIMKLTKTPLEGYELSWKEVWERLLKEEPEPSAVKLYGELIEFLKNIRHLYSPQNAAQVVDYFVNKHSLYPDNLFLFISLFTNLSHHTSSTVFNDYFGRLRELYEVNQLKASNMLVMFINALRFRHSSLSADTYGDLTNIVIYSLATPNPDKKDAIQQKFSTQTSSIVIKLIGTANPHSTRLLQQLFQILKNFIRPFEDSKKPLKFLYQLLAGLSKRIQKEDNCKQKIEKLKQKQQKRQKKREAQAQEAQREQQEESAVTRPQVSNITEAESIITQPEESTITQPPKEEEQEQSSEQESSDNDSQQEQQAAKMEKMVSLELDLQENNGEKSSNSQGKLQKLEAALQNAITPQIRQLFRSFVEQHFQSIFYVNSKKIVSRLLRELFRIFPEFVPRAFTALEKAGRIPQINEEGLLSNLRHIAKYIFSPTVRNSPDFLDCAHRLLARVQEGRRITDAWDVVAVLVQRIPLLDERDMQAVDEAEKSEFEIRFGQNHDRFYEAYSDAVFECVRRALVESEHYDQATSQNMDRHILELLSSCHSHFKKRVLRQVEEQILENSNAFLLTLFHSDLQPTPQLQTSLRAQTDQRSIESQAGLQLDINVNLTLGTHMKAEEFKTLVRKYAKKGNYRFLKQCLLSLNNYTLISPPPKSSLPPPETRPSLHLRQEPTFAFLAGKLQQVYDYSLEIVDELANELKEFSECPLKDVPLVEVAKRLYGGKRQDFKGLRVQKRKLVHELLQILRSLMENLFHGLGEYDAASNRLILKDCPYKRESLLLNSSFRDVVRALSFNQLFLHDHNIMLSLSSLLQNQIFFMYRHHIRLEKQVLKRFTKREQREELPGESSLANVNNIFIARARLAHFSILLNQHKDTVGISEIEKELRVLLVAPGNEKSSLINKILVKKTTQIAKQADCLIQLLTLSFDSRFYYEKILGLLAEFNTAGHSYSPQQIVALVDLHVPLIQSQIPKIREHSLKSLEKFLKTLGKDAVLGKVEQSLRKYANKQKLQLLWIISVVIVLRQPLRNTSLDLYLTQIREYMGILQGLVLSDTRIVRRVGLFAYSYCYRKAKKAVKKYQKLTAETQKYANPRTFPELFIQGYIREEHRGVSLSNRSMVRRMQPYHQVWTKTKTPNAIFEQLQKQSFAFVLDHPQVASALLKQFHTDMAGSVQQVMSMLQNKKQDLAEVALRVLEGCYMYSKLKKLNFDRLQFYFGERFFRYLLDRDANINSSRIFQETKGYVEQQLANLEPYDNQTLVFIYTLDLFSVYQKHGRKLQADRKAELQQFLLKVVSEIIYKGSGVLFKKLVVMLSKSDPADLKFLSDYLEGLISSKEKLPRVTQLLFTLHEDNYERFCTVAEFVLNERLEINSGYLATIVSSAIALPQRYVLTKRIVQKYGLIDPKAEIAEGRAQLFKDQIYLLSTKKFNDLLASKLADFLEEAGKTGEGEGAIQQRHELMRASYSLATTSITAYVQAYETKQSVTAVNKLLNLLFAVFEGKTDHAVDFKQLQETLKTLFANKYEDISHFQSIAMLVIDSIAKIPAKKQGELIRIIANRPANFLFASPQVYRAVLVKMLKLQENSLFYRDLLVGISTLLAYAPLSEAQIESLAEKLPKGASVLLLQCYILSTLKIGSKLVDRILRQSSKERRNVFCKQILVVRGKKEYLDGEEEYLQWRQIKQYSNPYHYHA